MITFLNNIKDEIFELCKYLYNNPEESFNEYKANNYISSLLRSYNFKVQTNYLDMPTAFYAQFGNGHPKICFLCAYDAHRDKGHIYGHNAKTAICVGAAVALSKIIPKIGGSSIVIGCPGEIIGGSKITMLEQGAFEDIDIILTVHPHTITAESGTSMAIMPMEINFSEKQADIDIAPRYSPLDACLFTIDALNIISRGFDRNCFIEGMSLNTISEVSPQSSEVKFSIKSSSGSTMDIVEKKIREFINATSSLLDVSSEIHLYDMPYKELVTNPTLSRLFSHNLKESGIIDISAPRSIYSCVDLGNVSHFVPCIYPYVALTEDISVKYGTSQFADATISASAKEIILKTSAALCYTAFDLIDKQSLIYEAREELNKKVSTTFTSLSRFK